MLQYSTTMISLAAAAAVHASCLASALIQSHIADVPCCAVTLQALSLRRCMWAWVLAA